MDEAARDLPLISIVLRAISTELLDAFDPPALEDLERELSMVRLARGETLFRQGDPGESMYVLIQGHLGVAIEDEDGAASIIDELSPGMTVGEMALLTGRPRSATVSAIENSELVQLSRAAFEYLSERNITAMRRFAEAILPRLQRAQLASLLNALFGPLTRSALHEIQAQLVWQHLRNGDALFAAGDPSSSLYLVVNGRLSRVIEQEDGGKQTTGEISRGEIVGEFELLTGEPHRAAIVAVRDSDVVQLSKPCFERLLQQYPQAMTRVARIMAKRMHATYRHEHGSNVVTFAVIPANQAVPLHAFTQRLTDVLALHGPTLYLNSERVEDLVGKCGIAHIAADHPTSITLVGWLSQQEARYRYIVYEADPSWSGWTTRCVHQADRILIVGRAELEPNPGGIEMELRRLRLTGRQELVLLQPEARPNPTGTGRWLQSRSVEAHHHVRLNSDTDMARLARRLTGRAIGLVLGGGGARGFAHIGVIRALEEVGMHADLVAGTSMGGLVAAYYARGMDPDMITAASKQFGSPRQLFDYTIPITSFFASKKLTNMLHALFEDVRIEDLWRPFFCVSSSLTRARPIIHREGLVWKAVRASLSIPGVFSPLVADGEILVDGGIMNNLPVDIMHEDSQAGIIIASSVSPDRELAAPYDWGTSISGINVLWSRLSPFVQRRRVPSILDILSRSREVSDVYQRRMQRSVADLFIASPVQTFSPMDYRPVEAIAAVGYQAAQQALTAWNHTRGST